MTDIEQWKADLARWGWRRTAHKAVMQRLKPWLTLCRVHVRKHDDAPVPELPEGMSARIASEDELMAAAARPEMGFDPQQIRAALDRGDLCGAVFDGERMVSYVWRSFSTAPHLPHLWVAVEKPYRYGYKGFTHPDYRGRRLLDAATRVTERVCLERGFTHGVGFIETHNYASVVSDLRRGNRCVGWAGYLTVFGRTWPFRTPGVRASSFRFYRPRSRGRTEPVLEGA